MRPLFILLLILTACTPAPAAPPLAVPLLANGPAGLILYRAGASPTALSGPQPNGAVCLRAGGLVDIYSGGTAYTFGDALMGLPAQRPASALGCDLDRGTQLSTDGKWIAALTYADEAGLGAEYAVGTLTVRDRASGAAGAPSAEVLAYDLSNENTVTLTLQADGKTRVFIQPNGAGERRTLVDPLVTPCPVVSGRVLRAAGNIYLSVGERCASPLGYFVTIFQIDPVVGMVKVLAERRATDGGFYPRAGANSLYMLPGGAALLWLYPDGKTTETADAYLVRLADAGAVKVASGIVTNPSPAPFGRRFQFNPAGTRLAFVARNGQGGDTLYLWDATKPDSIPGQLTDLIRGSRISGLAWSADGNRLAYVITGEKSVLGYVDERGEKRDAATGVFQGLTLNPDGAFAYTVVNEGGKYALLQVRLSDGARTVIVGGLESAPVPLVAR